MGLQQGQQNSEKAVECNISQVNGFAGCRWRLRDISSIEKSSFKIVYMQGLLLFNQKNKAREQRDPKGKKWFEIRRWLL